MLVIVTPLNEKPMANNPKEDTMAAGADEADFTVEPHAVTRRKRSKAPKGPKESARKLALTAAEFERLDQIKQACGAAGITVRKTELIWVAIALLAGAPLEQLAQARAALAPVRRK